VFVYDYSRVSALRAETSIGDALHSATVYIVWWCSEIFSRDGVCGNGM